MLDPARQALDLDFVRPFDRADFDDQVAAGAGLAQQCVAVPLLLGGQAGRASVRIVHDAVGQARAAGGAVPALATVGQIESGAQRGLEDGLVVTDRQHMTCG